MYYIVNSIELLRLRFLFDRVLLVENMKNRLGEFRQSQAEWRRVDNSGSKPYKKKLVSFFLPFFSFFYLAETEGIMKEFCLQSTRNWSSSFFFFLIMFSSFFLLSDTTLVLLKGIFRFHTWRNVSVQTNFHTSHRCKRSWFWRCFIWVIITNFPSFPFFHRFSGFKYPKTNIVEYIRVYHAIE